MLFIDDIFTSIQGESTDAGKITLFVRLHGCNLQCSFCDTKQGKKQKISVENLVNRIKSFHIPNVCITGGEPLTQPEIYSVIYELVRSGLNVAIETNGAVPIEEDAYKRSFKYIMDVKCPSSGMSSKNVYSNLANLKCMDEVVFVISDKKDYTFMKKTLVKYPTKATILLSPMFTEDFKPVIGQSLVDWLLEDRLFNVRLQVQMHKILNIK